MARASSGPGDCGRICSAARIERDRKPTFGARLLERRDRERERSGSIGDGSPRDWSSKAGAPLAGREGRALARRDGQSNERSTAVERDLNELAGCDVDAESLRLARTNGMRGRWPLSSARAERGTDGREDQSEARH